MGGKGYLHLGAVSLVFVHDIDGHLLLLFVCLFAFFFDVCKTTTSWAPFGCLWLLWRNVKPRVDTPWQIT